MKRRGQVVAFVFNVTVSSADERGEPMGRARYMLVARDDVEARERAVALYGGSGRVAEYPVAFCTVEFVGRVDG